MTSQPQGQISHCVLAWKKMNNSYTCTYTLAVPEGHKETGILPLGYLRQDQAKLCSDQGKKIK